VAGPQSLDEEELALLRLVAEALPDDQIATALGRDAASVARARQTLAARLGCKGRIALMNYARSHALRGRPV
jgi:DNA-binding NarL/FixJ family response regulator